MEEFKRQFWLKIQLVLLYIFYGIFKIFCKKPTNVKWVVGVEEIAANIYFLGNTLENATTVALIRDKFYEQYKYDYEIKYTKNIYWKIVFYSPILLAYLAATHSHFYYIWTRGFLLSRDREFKFLKSKNKKIVCHFCGADVRSLKLAQEYAKSHNLDAWVNYNPYPWVKDKDKYDELKRHFAHSADTYADVIFSAKIDQISYIKSKQYYKIYMYDKNNFHKNEHKFENMETINILHAPTHFIFKGTNLVRAAIKKLELEGYKFNFIEMQEKSNIEVLDTLKNTHIVLDQFYAYIIGGFAVEAMANNCALLASGDVEIETDMPFEKDAWLVTKYWQIYDNLKYLLDNPEKIKYYANNGYAHALKTYTYEAANKYINDILKENGVI